jgi:hypothetical protein
MGFNPFNKKCKNDIGFSQKYCFQFSIYPDKSRGNSSFVSIPLNKDELPHGFILWNNK